MGAEELFDVDQAVPQDQAGAGDTAGGSIVIRLHVQPAAGRTAVSGRHGDALRVRVAAPPVGGRANEACARLLAELLGTPAGQVELLSGPTSRSKRFRVTGVDPEQVRHLLDRAIADAAEPRRGRTGR